MYNEHLVLCLQEYQHEYLYIDYYLHRLIFSHLNYKNYAIKYNTHFVIMHDQ